MNSLLQHFSINTAFVLLTSFCVAADEKQLCEQSDNVKYVTHDIFDLTDEGTIFLHDWANFLHIKTKYSTLRHESAFFLNKCQFIEEDLSELERHLRAKKYIRNASVSYDEDNKVAVETWDNWSLMPTLDFGRKGGKNKLGIGIQERNLLGLGINAELEYFRNDQRSGFKLKTQFPLTFLDNTNARLRLTNSDDGTSEAMFVQKKFVSFDTQNAYILGFDNFNQVDTLYENGVESNQYRHEKSFKTASWHWLHNDSASDTLRFGLGFTQEDHTFLLDQDTPLTGAFADSILPANREFSYPFVAVEYLQKEYRKLTNINLINQIEDFNLGWNASANIGTGLNSNEGSPSLIWQSQVSKGAQLLKNSYWFFEAEFAGETYRNSQFKDRMLLQLTNEYFHKFNDYWGAYFKNINQIGKNQYADSPLVLGGETGVRGFPLQYQHGQHSTQFSFEARYYPHINIYKLLELGAAAFVDTGRVFNPTETSQQQSPQMTSIGLGMRFYSTHSSEARVIHLDVIKPITSDPNVNSIEIRATTKYSF